MVPEREFKQMTLRYNEVLLASLFIITKLLRRHCVLRTLDQHRQTAPMGNRHGSLT
jgi:hypothetical protein